LCTDTDYQDVPPCFEPDCEMCPYKNQCRNYKGTKITWHTDPKETNEIYTIKVTSDYSPAGNTYVSP